MTHQNFFPAIAHRNLTDGNAALGAALRAVFASRKGAEAHEVNLAHEFALVADVSSLVGVE